MTRGGSSFLAVIPVCLPLLLTPVASADTWVPVGPPGGDVRSLAVDPRNPRVVFLGTADGVLYRSDDAGLRWERLAPGFPKRGMSLDDLVVDTRGGLLVAFWEVGGAGGGVARSDDGGRTFTLLGGLGDQGVRALAVAPSDPDRVVAGTLRGVYGSENGGRTWRRLSPEGHPEIRNVDSVAIDPRDPRTIYVGTWHLPWKTTDGGLTWRAIHAGMIEDSDVMTLTLDRHDANTVFATACTGIYRSASGGEAWSRIRGIPSSSRRTRAFAQDSAHPDTFYAGTTQGLWASEDGASSWRPLTETGLVINAVAILPGGVLLLGCEGAGILRSVDRGRTWAAANEGFSERCVSRVVVDPRSGRIFAGLRNDRQHGGVFTLPRAGQEWVRLGSGLEGRELLALALVEGPSGQLLAGTDDGVYLYAAHGGVWRRLPTVVDGFDPHPRVTEIAVLGASAFVAATPQGLLRSTDAGETWQRHRLGLAGAILALAASGGEGGVLAAATPLGFYRSRDKGASWTQTSPSLPDAQIGSMAFLPGDPRVLFATTTHGLLRSADQGETWSRHGGGLPLSDITGLAFGADGRTAFASDFILGGLYRSRDAGATWERFGTDGLSGERIWTLAGDPSAPGRILAASTDGGLHELRPAEAAAAVAPSSR
jgi:photosystem II stability/assembly factor-like uncharacterized protein